MTNTDKEVLEILKSFLSDDEIKDAINKGHIKFGVDDIEKAEKEEMEDTPDIETEVEEEKEEEEEVEKNKKGKKIEKSESDSLSKKEKIEKSEEIDLLKSLESKISEVDDLKKSISDLTEKLSSMTDLVEKMANTPNAPKSVSKVQYFEKGQSLKDEEDRDIVSVSRDKEKLGEILVKSLQEEKDDIMKSQIESDIMNVFGAGTKPSEAVCKHLYKNKGIRIVE